MITKTSIMLGLGETKDELMEAMDDLCAIDVDIFTLDQYLEVVQFTCFMKMATLKEILPPTKSVATTFYDHSSDPWLKQRHSALTEDEKAEFIKTNPTPCQPTLL
ncbi:SNW/SKI-interacting protein A [Tanacetum coccineum]